MPSLAARSRSTERLSMMGSSRMSIWRLLPGEDPSPAPWLRTSPNCGSVNFAPSKKSMKKNKKCKNEGGNTHCHHRTQQRRKHHNRNGLTKRKTKLPPQKTSTETTDIHRSRRPHKRHHDGTWRLSILGMDTVKTVRLNAHLAVQHFLIVAHFGEESPWFNRGLLHRRDVQLGLALLLHVRVHGHIWDLGGGEEEREKRRNLGI